MFRQDLNDNCVIIIEADDRLILSAIDERLPESAAWRKKSDVRFLAKIIVDKEDALALIEKLLKHSNVYCVNHNMTAYGNHYYDNQYYLSPAYRPFS